MTPHTSRAQSVAGIVLKLAGTLLALYFVHDAWVERGAQQNETRRLKSVLHEKQQKVMQHADLAVQLQDMRALLSRVTQVLPSRFDSPAIEKSLREKAALAGIEIESLRTGTERVHEGFYVDRPVYLVVQGSTLGFMKFMDDMLRDSPLRRVNAMNIEPTGPTGSLRATLTVHHYHVVEDAE